MFNNRLWEVGGKTTFKQMEQMKKTHKSMFFASAILNLFWAIFFFKSETISFHIFPKKIQKSKKFEHSTLGSGGKTTFKRSEQMNKIL